MKNKFTTAIFLPAFLLITLISKSQTGWHELRSFGVNSYTSETIHTLTEDYNYQIIYAGIGDEVFRWKGGNTSWEQLGTDSSSLKADGIIYSITMDPSHNVYAAGWFRNSNGRYYVAKWNSSNFINNNWSELGGTNGLNASGPIYSVISDGAGNIYAAGSFFSKTGYRYVAKWDGYNWSELGTNTNALNANNYINALCADSVGNIYAAGDFTNSSGKKYVAKWNGTTWMELGNGNNSLNANASIKSIAVNKEGNVFAGGQFTNNSNKYYIAKWNGNNWTELGTGTSSLNSNGFIYSVITDASGNVYAAGDFNNSTGEKYVAKWNGINWSELGSAVKLTANNTIYSIAIDKKGSVFAAGDFTNKEGYKYVSNCEYSTESWAETAATGIGAFDPGSTATSIVTDYTDDTLYVAGCFRNGKGNAYVAKWDGNSWSGLGALNANSCIYTLATDKYRNVYAAGEFTGRYQPYVAKWNGSYWSDVGNSETALNAFGSINKIVSDSIGNLYVTGYFKNSTGKFYVAKWNGITWSELGTGINSLNSDEVLSALTIDKSGNVYVCAHKYFEYYVAKWNGSTWNLLTTNPFDQPLNKIQSIATDNAGNVYSTMSDWSAEYIRKWTGSYWTKLENQTNVSFFTIDKNDNLFILSDAKVKRWGGDRWYQVDNHNTSGFTSSQYLYSDSRSNLYTVGQLDNPNVHFIAKYNSTLLRAPLITGVSDKCADAPSSSGKLFNPNSSDTISITLDGIPLPYKQSDSSFQYFTNGATSLGYHSIVVKYINSNNVLVDSTTFNVKNVIVPSLNITTAQSKVCANTPFTIKCNSNIPGATYQWYLNNWPCIYNCNDSSLTMTLTNSDIDVYCQITIPGDLCTPSFTIKSNQIKMQLSFDNTIPSVTIKSNDLDNIICNNQLVSFTATTINEGNNPTFEWQRNGNVVGTNSKSFETNSLNSGDEIELLLKNNESCASQSTGSSNIISISKDTGIISLPDTVKTICWNSYTGISIGISPQTNYSYFWTSDPAGFISAESNPGVAPNSTTLYTVTRTSNISGCESSDNITVKVDNTCKSTEIVTYPNPAKNYVNIVLDTIPYAGTLIFELIDLRGKLIHKQVLSDRINSIDLHRYSPGLYVYKITGNDGVLKKGGKLIIQY